MQESQPLLVVLGAGAAGLMAAIHAAKPSHRVVVLDRNSEAGRKILISGGGRCNVLPSDIDPARYTTSSSRHLLKRFLTSWPLAEQRRFFEEEARLPLRLEESTGKLFPVADRSRAVRDALVRLATERGVEFRWQHQVTAVEPEGSTWKLTLHDRDAVVADAIIWATGGLSVPQTGSDGFGLKRLPDLGHKLMPTYPALTPLTLDPPEWSDLAGVSLEATLDAASRSQKSTATGGFLFTHRGYSGPALLDVSHVAVRARLHDGEHAVLRMQWGEHDEAAWQKLLEPDARQVGTVVRRELPTRLADRLLAESAIEPARPLAQLTRAERRRLIDVLTNFVLPWTSDEGYRKAEVTGGGIALDQVIWPTLESRHAPGIFLAGELLDAFGPIGGYNFVWAWTTGRLAGLGAGAMLAK